MKLKRFGAAWRRVAVGVGVVVALSVGLVSPVAAQASTIYDSAASLSMRNLVNAMSSYGMMNGDNFKNVTVAGLRGWGWTPGANDSVDIWVEGTGKQWRATLRDARGSTEYSYVTTGRFNGLAANVRGASSPQPIEAPQPAGVRISSITQGIDETALAAALVAGSVTALEVCAATATVPGPRSTSSLPNHTVACMAAANAPGATTLSVLRALASTPTGRAVIATISRDFISTPPWVNTVAPETQIPTPPPAHQDSLGPIWRKTAIVSSVKLRNAGLTDEQVSVAVDECLKQVAAARLGTDPYNECVSKPIFLSGRDVPEATDHDIEALATNPAWVALNYENRDRTDWYTSDPRCIGKGSDQQCDEYPFNATAQGGQFAAPPVSLKPINDLQNMAQGTYYGAFVTACKVRDRQAMDFLAIPIPAAAGSVPTFRVCNNFEQ